MQSPEVSGKVWLVDGWVVYARSCCSYDGAMFLMCLIKEALRWRSLSLHRN